MFEGNGGRGVVEPVQVGDPIVACAGELRGLPGARSAAVLSAWTYQPSDAPLSPVGPLDEVVEVVLVAQSLIVEGRHQRTAVLARAGLIEWGKLHLLTSRLDGLLPLVAEQVERRLIPDADLDCAAGAGELNPRRDPRRPGADLPFL